MLVSILNSNLSFAEKVVYFLVSVLTIMISLTVHEFSHGFSAYKLGDSTAKADGRLSLNPLRHLDPYGTIMLLIAGFGYAKPVPVITRNFRKPRRDFAIVSLCGPLSNFVLAFVSAFLYVLLYKLASAEFLEGAVGVVIHLFFKYMIVINIGLGLFNLIPLPPLDGSNVVMCLLPNKAAAQYSKLRYYAQYILLGIILLSWVAPGVYDIIFWPLRWLRGAMVDGFVGFWAIVFGL